MQNNYSSDRATPPTSIKKNFKRIVLTGITLCLILCVIFSFAACLFDGDDDADPTTPGQTEPPSSDTDNPNNSNENDNDGWDDVIVPDDPVIDPDLPTDPEIPGEPEDPVIDPDDPVIDPDDPVINPDPSDPTDPINPGDGNTSDFPKSIYEVDEIDEINYFADEFIQIVNKNYGDKLAQRMIGASATRENLANADWSITQYSETGITQIEVKSIYESGIDMILRVGTITFDREYLIQDILGGNTNTPTYSRTYNASTETSKITPNLLLGKTVISTIDPDNTLGGDIWCSIGSPTSIAGNTYREITVYQITDNGVQNFTIWALANGTSDPEVIKDNIENNKINGSGTQSTEYTFAGEKIEQIPLPEEA